MTFITALPVPPVARRLLPLARPVLLAVADAYGVGLPVRAVGLGLTIARVAAGAGPTADPPGRGGGT
ncbi:hypothetical protein [Streptantibioticus cattleyicolor]|uniref:Uncharacterized protein n=1 Tax=Streptantibioticus cattleyicolor (strain ATCC 35852 / DSM 46488 / JCM 4925 / NBRC 14057 / NRRL 8057) TaxID=1003195 RepID=F8JKW0_STREN